MLILISIPLILLTSVFIIAQLKLHQKVAYFLAIFLAAWAQIIFISELLSLLHLLNLSFYLALQILLAVISGFFWKRNGSLPLLGPLASLKKDLLNLKASIKKHPVLACWLLITAALYALLAILILTVPQNNYDSMTYHLSRVAYWLQHQSLAPWLTPNPRQTTFPINAELGVLWTVLFTGSDRWSGFVQWLSTISICLAILGIARMLGATRSQALFSALLFSNFSGIILQSTTTQNDLVITAFFTSSLYFYFLARKEQTVGPLLFSALGIGLSIGAKSTVAFILPAFAICAFLEFVIGRFKDLRFYLRWAALCIMMFLFFGAFTYIQNQIAYHNPFSDKVWTEGIVHTPISRTTLLGGNSLFYTYQMLDFSGLPEPVASFLTTQKSGLFQKIFRHLPFRVEDAIPDQSLPAILNAPATIHEDTTWFGIIAFLTLIPAAIYQLIVGLRTKQDNLRWILVVLGVGFVITFSLGMSWSPYKGRYFILPVAVIAPLTYFIYSKKKPVIPSLVVILSLTIAVNTLLNNSAKALVGQNAIWGQDRLELQTSTNQGMQAVIQLVESDVPQNATLATRLGQDDWDYPFFGDSLQRHIVQLDPRAEKIEVQEVRNYKADYLLVSPMKRTFLQLPEGLEYLGEANGWSLFHILPEGSSSTISGPDFTGLTDAGQLVFLDPELAKRVGILAATSGNWGVEPYDGHGIIWIGEKTKQGLQIYIWAEEATNVKFTFQLSTGGGLPTPERNLVFSHWRVSPYLENPTRVSSQPYQMHAKGPAAFTTQLQAGLNKIILYCQDEATIRSQPNGDQRPLLVLVNRVDVNEIEAIP